ncbi:hypothetical protein [Clostridium estertheticum]|uniref:hypothetical protein n=1 Tax=Clostridium estertheticum TaxID=238834 RepID=UPI000A7CA653|nr:hypothetical protein [Clostridium estertheticum]MBU3172741.1 hypothetical protein [Clostridium estertheticum]MBZ9616748.1 hypothetical protein [Clostridium estertheticum subsp. laramiense]WAG72456.1 hypothetical protein LL032_15015 [Clostridium estertheticum]
MEGESNIQNIYNLNLEEKNNRNRTISYSNFIILAITPIVYGIYRYRKINKKIEKVVYK